jgi:hypothetical protein
MHKETKVDGRSAGVGALRVVRDTREATEMG